MAGVLMPAPTLPFGAFQLSAESALPEECGKPTLPQNCLRRDSLPNNTNPIDGFTTIDTVKRPLLPLIRRGTPDFRDTSAFYRVTPWRLAGWSLGGTVAQWLERALHKR